MFYILSLLTSERPIFKFMHNINNAMLKFMFRGFVTSRNMNRELNEREKLFKMVLYSNNCLVNTKGLEIYNLWIKPIKRLSV